jgi:calcineurin-like phosphoesterase family protein
MTPDIYFTADSHHRHKRIIEIAKRPFSSNEEMDGVLIERWNSRVKKNSDLVFHLGDFSFAEHTPYLQRLNGQKHLCPGNHDKQKFINSAEGWCSVRDLRYLKLPDGTKIMLCHYAMRTWRNSHHGALHLYGHSHGSMPGDSQCLDVGVDCWDFYPVNIDEIRWRLRTQPSRSEPDHHQPKEEQCEQS